MKLEKMKPEKMKSRFPASLFFVYCGVLLLMSGVHTGLMVLMFYLETKKILQILVILAYWFVVAVGLTWFTRMRMQQTYETPMQRLAEATRRVAGGDFSVYIPPIHIGEETDYLDVMIGDFNKMVEELGSIETLKTDFFSSVSHEIKTLWPSSRAMPPCCSNMGRTPRNGRNTPATSSSPPNGCPG